MNLTLTKPAPAGWNFAAFCDHSARVATDAIPAGENRQ
jgi:hypothetical protein